MTSLAKHWVVALTWLALSLVTRLAHADDQHCTGPAECCPDKLVEHFDHPVRVSAGFVVLGIANVNEKSGTWDADFYLTERWAPTVGFTPRTEVVNEVERKSATFDDTVLRDGTCTRSRRIHATLRSEFNLHAFPFDEQHLTMVLSDNEFDVARVVYADKPDLTGLEDEVRNMVSGWRVSGEPTYAHAPRVYRWEPGAPHYDYATFSVAVRRHVTFHATRYFLPLLLIVVVAFSAFWIHPEDLGSQVGLGVTCLLAAVALQFAEAGTLPEVAYLTLADRVYATCYVAIASAVVESVAVNALVRAEKRALAVRIDHTCRWLFPIALLACLGVVTARSFA